MANYTDGYWWSPDGLRLHYRDYAPRNVEGLSRPTILCIPGLTRNARDFADLAERLSAEWRVICVELRGRGESGYAKDALSYTPLTYVQDLAKLLVDLGIERPILFGTSLGGILTMLLTSTGQVKPVAAMLNDVGPDLDPTGLSRIKTYVGKQANWPTWLHAARGLAAGNAHVYPDWELADWLAHAKRLCRLTPAGRVNFDYDMKIAEPFRLPGGEVGVDLWPAFDSLRGIPTLLFRGELSDLLTDSTCRRMVERHGGLDYVVVPRVGHTPLLTEPECTAAIDRLLDKARLSGNNI